jgi:hypothetical protein
MKLPGTLALWLAAATLAAILAGCEGGKTTVSVTGRLLQDGQPLQVSSEGLPPGTQPIRIVFHPVLAEGQPGGEAFACKVDTGTGEFTVPGPAGRGIPPGKYRISVSVLSAAPGGPAGPGAPNGGRQPGPPGFPPGPGGRGPGTVGVLGLSDRFGGAFSPERSPLEVEIARSSEVLVEVGSQPGATVR